MSYDKIITTTVTPLSNKANKTQSINIGNIDDIHEKLIDETIKNIYLNKQANDMYLIKSTAKRQNIFRKLINYITNRMKGQN